MSTVDETPETSMPEPEDPELPRLSQTPQMSQTSQTPPAPPAEPLDRVEPLNLARKPFLNSRPVVRVSLLLWLIGLALLLWNVVQFQRYLEDSAEKRAQIEQGDREIARQRKASSDLETQLAGLDLDKLNEQVEFLNQKIDERTFSWSLLLDRIAEVLPNDVRLVRMTPRTGDRDRAASTQRARQATGNAPRRILLEISGETRNDGALLQFVDNLFAHPAFADPDLTREERQEETGNLVTFELKVQYIPGGAPQGAVIEEEGPAIQEIPMPPIPGKAPAAGIGGPGNGAPVTGAPPSGEGRP